MSPLGIPCVICNARDACFATTCQIHLTRDSQVNSATLSLFCAGSIRMALPPALLNTFLPAELEFVAELDDVDIVPLFRMLPIRTIAVPSILCSCL